VSEKLTARVPRLFRESSKRKSACSTTAKRSDTDSRSKRKEHHQDTKTPRKAKELDNAVLGGLGVLVVGIHFLAS
jgi:hypothetical protein